MPSTIVFLDESGDLGWRFDAPYRQGGSSRYLTIAALCVPVEKKHIPQRVVKDLHRKCNWTSTKEKKWVDMRPLARGEFVRLAKEMALAHNDIHLHGIIVKKENVLPHIRRDANKLYNYMIGLALLDRMSKFDVVTLIPDPRSIKVQSGNSLHDYLQTELWFTKNASTNLITTPQDSATSVGLQFTDMLSGVIQNRFEDNASDPFQALRHQIQLKQLFF